MIVDNFNATVAAITGTNFIYPGTSDSPGGHILSGEEEFFSLKKNDFSDYLNNDSVTTLVEITKSLNIIYKSLENSDIELVETDKIDGHFINNFSDKLYGFHKVLLTKMKYCDGAERIDVTDRKNAKKALSDMILFALHKDIDMLIKVKTMFGDNVDLKGNIHFNPDLPNAFSQSVNLLDAVIKSNSIPMLDLLKSWGFDKKDFEIPYFALLNRNICCFSSLSADTFKYLREVWGLEKKHLTVQELCEMRENKNPHLPILEELRDGWGITKDDLTSIGQNDSNCLMALLHTTNINLFEDDDDDIFKNLILSMKSVWGLGKGTFKLANVAIQAFSHQGCNSILRPLASNHNYKIVQLLFDEFGFTIQDFLDVKDQFIQTAIIGLDERLIQSKENAQNFFKLLEEKGLTEDMIVRCYWECEPLRYRSSLLKNISKKFSGVAESIKKDKASIEYLTKIYSEYNSLMENLLFVPVLDTDIGECSKLICNVINAGRKEKQFPLIDVHNSCAICFSPLFMINRNTGEARELECIVTQCGHLFHTNCLQLYSSSRYSEMAIHPYTPIGQHQQITTIECPMCRMENSKSELLSFTPKRGINFKLSLRDIFWRMYTNRYLKTSPKLAFGLSLPSEQQMDSQEYSNHFDDDNSLGDELEF